uniref:Uncharacterized protein n=1 Tax=Timema poppense TaxID=170557 RepID=A0A7R9DUF3_TIMPO|nr:unnamed protein product [Timema poppensis]
MGDYFSVLIVSFGMGPLEGSLTLLCSFLLLIGVRQSRSLLILPCLLLLVTELFVSLSQAIVTIPKISDKDEVLLTRTIAIVIFVVLFVKFLMAYYVWDVYEEKKIKEVVLSIIN